MRQKDAVQHTKNANHEQIKILKLISQKLFLVQERLF